MALTVGVGTVMDAKEVVVIATGEKKAVAVRMAVEEGVNHWWTMSALQMHANTLLVVDEEATGELKVKTVQYFKQIEEVAASMGIDHALQTTIKGKNPSKLAAAKL